MKISASYRTNSLLQDVRPRECSTCYRFDNFELSTLPLRLTRLGTPITLQPQPARALKLLVEHRGGIVTREMLREHLWGKGTFLDHEQGINFALRKIRIALGDSPSAPRFIETVPRLGYRFVAAVEELKQDTSNINQRPQRVESSGSKSEAPLKRLGMLGRRPIGSGSCGRRRRAGSQKCRSSN